MELTNVLHTHRSTLTISDHATYHSYLTRRILSIRKRLGITTSKSQKFVPREITSDDVSKNNAYFELLLLQAERCWARAIQVKSLRGEGGLKGKSRSEVVSKSVKASKIAGHIVDIVKNLESGHSQPVLEALAYHALLNGGAAFERLSSGQRKEPASKQEWEACLRQWSEARVIYAAILEKTGSEAARELLSGTIDPTIRYVAYQAGVARTVGIVEVARKYFPSQNSDLVKAIEKLDPYAFTGKPKQYGEQVSQTEIPASINWRGRRAGIVDASIGQALASVYTAQAKLKEYLAQTQDASAKQKAAAYDEILIASQDAADATKRASDELEKERVDESNARMQDLRITSLAVNYELVSWRVGRNRVLIDENDGLHFKTHKPRKTHQTTKKGKVIPEKEESIGRKLARLRERIVLFDSSIQSIESVKDLPGALRDSEFVSELEAKTRYFRALKCLNISYSHRICGEYVNALALLNRANELVSEASAAVSPNASEPLDLKISRAQFDEVQSTISSLLAQDHALATLRQFEQNSLIASEKKLTSQVPWVERLDDFPTPGTTVDLKDLVNYPVKIEPVPVKPIFLDIAWNYIEYPGRMPQVEAQAEITNGVANATAGSAGEEKRRGWFGFGR